MSLAQMRKRCPASVLVGVAKLEGYQLTFPRVSTVNWQGSGVAGVKRENGSQVWGVVYKLTEICEQSLDKDEHVPKSYYKEENLTVTEVQGKVLKCLVYMANDQPGAPFSPSDEYLDRILSGAKENKLPAEYIQQIENWRNFSS